MLARADGERYGDSEAAAPFPGLVSLGTLDDSRLLLNLEAVPGIVSLSGAAADRDAVFASVAAELATSGWSDRMTVTLVGFGEELTAIAPTRLRHLDGVPALLETMEAETRQRRGALGTAGHDSVLTGRTGPAQHTRWAPHLVLLAAEPTAEEATRLAELAADAPRLGFGYFIGTESGELPGAAWEMEITPEGRLLAPLLGLELDAQRVEAAEQRALVDLFTTADPDHEPEPGAAPPPFLVDVTEQGRPAVYARMVGPYEIIGIDAPDGSRSLLLHEALAQLLLHREGVHVRVLASALWPRGVTEDVRDALVDRLRDWLGTDEDGTPRLTTDEAGRLHLAKSVVSDLDVLRSLYHEATQGAVPPTVPCAAGPSPTPSAWSGARSSPTGPRDGTAGSRTRSSTPSSRSSSPTSASPSPPSTWRRSVPARPSRRWSAPCPPPPTTSASGTNCSAPPTRAATPRPSLAAPPTW